MCKIYTEYHDTREIEHGLCACTVDNPLAKALSRTCSSRVYRSVVEGAAGFLLVQACSSHQAVGYYDHESL